MPNETGNHKTKIRNYWFRYVLRNKGKCMKSFIIVDDNETTKYDAEKTFDTPNESGITDYDFLIDEMGFDTSTVWDMERMAVLETIRPKHGNNLIITRIA